jgi:hypothetical protein
VALVQVDLQLIQDRIVAAERRVVAAKVEIEAANAELDLARQIERAVTSAIVGAPSVPTEPPVDGDVDDEQGNAFDVYVMEGPLAGMSTKVAVTTTLRNHRGRVFSLEELVEEMKRNGFSRTSNAVHVQLSRLIGTAGYEDIERVRMGHYQALTPRDPGTTDTGGLTFSAFPQADAPAERGE